MAYSEIKDSGSLFPDPYEAELAKEARDKLITLFQKKEKVYEFEVRRENGKSEVIKVPSAAFSFFFEILKQMANGNAVTVIPYHAKLTTQEAANFLNVSRPYLVKLLEEGAIPFTKVGRHRRVLFDDILAYKKKISTESEKVRDDLTKEAQRLGLGY